MAYFAPLAGLLLVGFASVALPDLPGNGKGLVQRTYAGELEWQLVAVLLVPLLSLWFARILQPGAE